MSFARVHRRMDQDDRTDTTRALHEPRTRLREVAGSLGAFLTGSEDVFLDAGRRVAGLEQRARSLVEGAKAAGAFRSRDGADDPAAALGRELGRMSQHLQASQEAVAEAARRLAALLGEIEILLRSESHFESIPPTLRMLGLNTRIENARSDAQYSGMETVALEVRRLGDEVEPKFRAVFRQAGGLVETVRTGIQAAEGFLHGQETSFADMLAQTRAALDSLQTLVQAGAGIADRAVSASELLARDLGALLVALQGHDATRQVIEHVIAELQALEAEGERAGDGAADAWTARLADGARVAAAQLHGARERFLASLDGISGSLRAIDGIGAALSRDTATFGASGSGASASSQVRQGVDRATHCLLQFVAHEAATGVSMGRVVETVEGITHSVKDILGIGSAVKIIALNALVETERAGQGGRVLAVLAQGIGSLAGEVVQRTGEVARALAEISTLASALRAGAARGGAAEGQAIAGGLERLSLRLSEIQRGLDAAVAGMHAGSRALGEEVEALRERVGQAGAAADRLAEAEGVLHELAAEARELGPPPEAGEAVPARAYARYTMESERAIHEHVVKGLAPPPETPAAAPAAGADGLGANVELF